MDFVIRVCINFEHFSICETLAYNSRTTAYENRYESVADKIVLITTEYIFELKSLELLCKHFQTQSTSRYQQKAIEGKLVVMYTC